MEFNIDADEVIITGDGGTEIVDTKDATPTEHSEENGLLRLLTQLYEDRDSRAIFFLVFVAFVLLLWRLDTILQVLRLVPAP